MNKTDLICLIPLWILSSTAIAAFFSISIKRNHKVIFLITVVSFIADFIFLTTYSINHKQTIEPLLVFDGFGIFNIGLILLTTLIIVMMSYAYFEQREERKEEYYILLTLAALGACIMVI
ncbi:MAG TPA: NADH-quinone oxidoreductase subunit N, partial [Cyclobacteriaceae bacterium]|nr:NADH-quinone oxidoreductase subunit N [Cyclobacteriaceae bacterium]